MRRNFVIAQNIFPCSKEVSCRLKKETSASISDINFQSIQQLTEIPDF